MPRPVRACGRTAAGALRRSIRAILAPPLVLGGICAGIFTASEAAAVSALCACLVGIFVYRNLALRDIWDCADRSMRTSMMVLTIIAGAAVLGHAITIIRLPLGITEAVAAMGLGPMGFTIAIILVTTPILLPTVAALDSDLIWFGVLLMINLELAMIPPPVGMNLFVITGKTDASLSDVVTGAAPYGVLMIAGVALVLPVPGLATWLPSTAGFGR